MAKKTAPITIRLTETQVESIQRRNDLYGEGSCRQRSDGLEDSVTKQIVKAASKLFPAIKERERQHALAWEIQATYRGNEDLREKVSAIRAGYEKTVEELREHQIRLSTEIVKLDREIEEKICVLFNEEFDKAGVTIYRSGYPFGLRKKAKEANFETKTN